MPKKRSTVMLDPKLVSQAGRILKMTSTTEIVDHLLTECVRRDAMNRLADMLGSEEQTQAPSPPPRRRAE